jgi:hypothetical protein
MADPLYERGDDGPLSSDFRGRPDLRAMRRDRREDRPPVEAVTPLAVPANETSTTAGLMKVQGYSSTPRWISWGREGVHVHSHEQRISKLTLLSPGAAALVPEDASDPSG